MERVPLGGDGYAAPNFAYSVAGFQVTGAVGGGSAGLTIILDPRFASLIAYMTANITQVSSADADVRFNISDADGHVPRQLLQGPVAATAAGVSGQTIGKSWSPVPSILPAGPGQSFCSVSFLNVDANVYQLDALIYCFNIDVRQKTPMGPLLWSRGST